MANIIREPVDGAQEFFIIALDSDYALPRDQLPAFVTAVATGPCVLTLPQNAKSGDSITAVCVATNFELRIDPGEKAIFAYDGDDEDWATRTGKYISSITKGDTVKLVYDGAGTWIIAQQSGFDVVEA